MPNIQEVDRADFWDPAGSSLERRAYQAAHEIFMADFEVTHLATPGARRTKVIDEMARIIMEACEDHELQVRLKPVSLDRRAV